jgi:signal transduction histidine kinase
MEKTTNPKSGDKGNPSWVCWRESLEGEAPGHDPWLGDFRLQSFRFLAALAMFGLSIIFFRGALLGGNPPLSDLANAVAFGILLAASYARPRWIRAYIWLGLASLFVNTFDGLDFSHVHPVTPTHVLLPLLILYGALLGDIAISLLTTAVALAIYAYTWMHYDRLERYDVLLLSNLCVLAFFSGVSALRVWLQHSRLTRMFDRQARQLRRELDTRLRIQALVAHDIRNPLTVLLNAVALNDPEMTQQMAERIAGIVNSADHLARDAEVTLRTVRVSEIWDHLREVFAPKLQGKAQKLETRGDPELTLTTDLAMLCNSVLGNFLSNASKFSPRESILVLRADSLGDHVRLSVEDCGPGFPPEVLEEGPAARGNGSRDGTEGEKGSGHGLRIAALCANRLSGWLEARNHEGGGAVAVILPRARA